MMNGIGEILVASLIIALIIPLIKPQLSRYCVGIITVVLAVMLGMLIMNPEAAWIQGSGTLRGIPMGFSHPIRSSILSSWTSLGLLLGLWYSLNLTLSVPAEAFSRRSWLAIAGIFGLVITNTMTHMLAAWTLVIVSGVMTVLVAAKSSACGKAEEVGSEVSAAAGLSLLSIGILFSIVAIQSGYGVLYTAEGHGGALDLNTLSGIRHAQIVIWGGMGLRFTVAAPLLLVATIYGVIRLYSIRPAGIPGIGATAGVLLAIKSYPILDLGVRDGSVVLLALAAAVLLGWSALRSGPGCWRREALLGFGAILFLGARIPGAAVLWILLWLPAVSTRDTGSRLGMLLPLFWGALLLATLASWTGTYGPWVKSGVLLGIFSLGIIMAGGRPTVSWHFSTQIVLAIAVGCGALFNPQWPLWSSKLHHAVPSDPYTWIVTVAALGAGFLAKSLFDGKAVLALQESIDQLEANTRRLIFTRIAPVADVIAVIWIALERFFWQGLTLYWPRRLLETLGAVLEWFDRVVLAHIRLVPESLIKTIHLITARLIRMPGVIPLVIIVLLALMWLNHS